MIYGEWKTSKHLKRLEIVGSVLGGLVLGNLLKRQGRHVRTKGNAVGNGIYLLKQTYIKLMTIEY